MKLLLTGFDPFGGEHINPAWEAVQRVQSPPGVTLLRLQVPTVFGASVDMVTAAIREQRPDAVLCIGQAAGRAALTPERVAINCMDASLPDNAGRQPMDEPVVPGGPAAYFATIPIKAMAEAIRAAGLPAEISNSAGTFVCNQLLYGVLHFLTQHAPAVGGGFLHVPALPEQAERSPRPIPSLPLEDIVLGLEAAIGVL